MSEQDEPGSERDWHTSVEDACKAKGQGLRPGVYAVEKTWVRVRGTRPKVTEYSVDIDRDSLREE